ncbi:hypothetical protein SmJEL517_g05285 [Synchytrium microbalum]|uniref:Uncharacterized protein n=1 Tax=Synchytrium microbalum TaxID=1806994 RepID=A0A507C1B0_9FUNG|nr:uncharacterized protein SmJEL517_g05285 [Synchytrium microbalum]TPX31355.1 hypothetical protein SmJEL517_g05285 [Synchytrium microbalum]
MEKIKVDSETIHPTLTEALKINGRLVKSLQLTIKSQDTVTPTLKAWKDLSTDCTRLHTLSVEFQASKIWNTTVTAIIKANPELKHICLFEKVESIKEPSDAPWFICESPSRRSALASLVNASAKSAVFTLKLSPAYSFELRPEFYQLPLALEAESSPLTLETEGMGDIKREYRSFFDNATAFKQQQQVELYIECDGNADCSCRKPDAPLPTTVEEGEAVVVVGADEGNDQEPEALNPVMDDAEPVVVVAAATQAVGVVAQ